VSSAETEYLARLTGPQSAFYQAQEKYPLFVGGFGSGKSTVMSVAAITDLINFPGANIACYAPTYDLLKLVTEPYIAERLDMAGLHFTFNKSDHIFKTRELGSIICRSLSNPERIIAYEVFRSHVDELDTLRLIAAEEAWNKVIARNRQKIYVLDPKGHKILRPDWEEIQTEGVAKGLRVSEIELHQTEQNRVSAYTTPEGYMFAYKRWVKSGGAQYGIYRASTRSNPHLPEGYIQGLIDTYPEELIHAYLDGEFVNLTSGSVYPQYDRELNRSDETVQANEPLCVGMDFNVLYGAAGIHVMRGDEPHCVDQIHNAYDTDAQIAALKDRYPQNPITVYPDASGDSRTSSNTTASDIAKLKAAGFRVKVRSSNPPIKNRVASMNAMICNGKGERRYRINYKTCPDVAAGLEQQVYDKTGMPDKSGGHDHILDGCGYYIDREFGIVRPRASLTVIQGSY
jgi:hypothetical protein